MVGEHTVRKFPLLSSAGLNQEIMSSATESSFSISFTHLRFFQEIRFPESKV
jgi:hypothetical protein